MKFFYKLWKWIDCKEKFALSWRITHQRRCISRVRWFLNYLLAPDLSGIHSRWLSIGVDGTWTGGWWYLIVVLSAWRPTVCRPGTVCLSSGGMGAALSIGASWVWTTTFKLLDQRSLTSYSLFLHQLAYDCFYRFSSLRKMNIGYIWEDQNWTEELLNSDSDDSWRHQYEFDCFIEWKLLSQINSYD